MAAAFGEIFGGEYHAGQLRKMATTKASGGTLSTTQQGPLLPCLYQREKITWSMRQREGYTDRDARFFVLAAPLGADVDHPDHLLADAAEWQVQTAVRDPAGAYWDLHVTPASPPAP